MYHIEPELFRDEKILYRSRYHWIYYCRALWPFFASFALGTILWVIFRNQVVAAISLLFLVLSVLWFAMKVADAVIKRAYITNQRLIYRQGWAHKNTVDVTLDRIGGVIVTQDVWQRIFGHGTVKVILPVVEIILPRHLNSAVEFRQAITKALQKPAEPAPIVEAEGAEDDEGEA